MNRDEAKNILLLYRTEADAADPQIAEALALAKTDAELSRWFAEHCAAQSAVREKFRQIEIPAGLMQQIISEQKAGTKISRREKMVLAVTVAAIVISIGVLAIFFLPRGSSRNESAFNTFSNFEDGMIRFARSGYAMDLATNNLAQIQNYFAQNHAPSDYTLTAALEKTAATGCAVKNWSDANVSMICFSTGKPLRPNQSGDLWLFIIDRSAIKDAPQASSPQIATVNGITAAVWTQGGKIYLLGVEGDEQTLRKYL